MKKKTTVVYDIVYFVHDQLIEAETSISARHIIKCIEIIIYIIPNEMRTSDMHKVHRIMVGEVNRTN